MASNNVRSVLAKTSYCLGIKGILPRKFKDAFIDEFELGPNLKLELRQIPYNLIKHMNRHFAGTWKKLSIGMSKPLVVNEVCEVRNENFWHLCESLMVELQPTRDFGTEKPIFCFQHLHWSRGLLMPRMSDIPWYQAATPDQRIRHVACIPFLWNELIRTELLYVSQNWFHPKKTSAQARFTTGMDSCSDYELFGKHWIDNAF